MTLRHTLLLSLALATPLDAHPDRQPGRAPGVPGMLVIGVAGDPVTPIPFFTSGTPEGDVSDQLFLRLGNLGSSFNPTGDQALTPMLAESWKRVDSLTLLFTIHPRAKWHDGVPVTAKDFVFTWKVASTPTVNPDQSMIGLIASMDAVDARTLRVRFRRVFPEQLYLVGFTLQALPAHLLERVPPDSIGAVFAGHPVGNGPYRFERRVPGQQVELRADTAFFRGRPTIQRLIFRSVPDAQTRMTMLLAGELDLIDNVLPPQAVQVTGHADYRTVSFPGNLIVYALFNTRAATDSSKPSPILSDRRVREALAIGLDRPAMARAILGQGAVIPEGVRSQAWSWVGPTPPAPPQVARARALLDQAGWQEIGPDGIRRRNGVPLRLRALYLNTSAVRTQYAVSAQQAWRTLGVDLVLDGVDRGLYGNRRYAGDWDMDFASVNQDITPTSLTQSWSCATATIHSGNVAHWCDPVFDRLLAQAASAKAPQQAWQTAFARMAEERPAAVLAAPLNQVALHARYAGVLIWPARAYLSVWQWHVRPEAALPRDR